jgi:hypothetical protein
MVERFHGLVIDTSLLFFLSTRVSMDRKLNADISRRQGKIAELPFAHLVSERGRG